MDGISLIIPVYNREDFIGELADVIKTQLDSDIEVIFVDDGSTDNSRKIIIDKCDSLRNVKLISTIHAGPGAARNRGLAEATKEYIWFVDSDDLIAPDAISKLKNIVNSEDKISDLFVFNFSTDGEDIILFKENRKSFNKNEGMELFLNNRFYNCVWNKLFKTKLIKENGCKFPEDVCNGEDGVFILSYLDKTDKIAYLNENIYKYRINANSLTAILSAEIFKTNFKVYGIKKKYAADYNVKSDYLDNTFSASVLKNIVSIINDKNSREDIIEAYRYIFSNKELLNNVKKIKCKLHPALDLLKFTLAFKNPELLYKTALTVIKIKERIRNK